MCPKSFISLKAYHKLHATHTAGKGQINVPSLKYIHLQECKPAFFLESDIHACLPLIFPSVTYDLMGIVLVFFCCITNITNLLV